MKTRLGLFWVALAMFAAVPAVNAQYDQPYGGGGPQGNFQPMVGDYQIGMPGRVWFETNFADRGLGYQGSYLTLGGKTRLFEDFLDGRWLGESQLHYSMESGRFFGNLGMNRVFSVQSAGADFSVGGWIDYDDDKQGTFAHAFTQVGINGSIKTRKWDVIGNGYFPVGTTDYTFGDPTGEQCFIDNRILMVPGIDTALEGFDATLRLRPQVLSMVNGNFDIGGYGYQSALVDQFGGARVRLGFQLMQGMIINTEVNHDNRFDLTGIVQLAFAYGANARGNEYSGVGRDLEPTIRNDHIVRFQQDLVFAIDPDTGRPYNVIHVDNNADGSVGDGRVETPYDRLSSAETASATDDIIFVHTGDGTSRNYSSGMVLKDGQMYLGDGAEHLIPVQDGRFFLLCNDLSFSRPVITAKSNGAAVTLANRNTVRGFIMDGSLGSMGYGIYGDGFAAGSPINSGIIEDNDISGAILHGTYVNDSIGDWKFARNNIRDNGFDGIFLENAGDPTSVFEFEDNVITSNGRDGIHMLDYDASEITFLRNTTDNNLRDGIRLENYLNGSGLGLDLDILGHSSNNNAGSGVSILAGTGNLRVLNSSFTGNAENGLRIVDWTNATGEQTLIGVTSGGISDFAGNNVGINIEQNVGLQSIVMQDLGITGNTVGVRVVANNVPSVVDTVLRNNNISGNSSDGAQFSVLNGASHFVSMLNDNLIGNGGNGIRFTVGDSLGVLSTMTTNLENVTIGGSALDGILTQVFNDGTVDFNMSNSVVTGSGARGLAFLLNNDEQGFVNHINVRSSNVNGHGSEGLLAVTSPGTLTDISLIESTFNGNGGAGVRVAADGDSTVATIDNRTRLTMLFNTANNNTAEGVLASSTGDAHLLTNYQSNTASGNGAEGIRQIAANVSVLSTRVNSNQLTGNTGDGLLLQTFDFASIDASVNNNNIAGNGSAANAAFINDVTATICMEMSNNNFAGIPTFTNAAAPVSFRVELDGSTNGFTQADLGPTLSYGPYGSVCNGNIVAEEAAFAAAGF